MSGIALANGTLRRQGTVDSVVREYLPPSSGAGGFSTPRSTTNGFFIEKISVIDPVSQKEKTPSTWSSVTFRIYFHSPRIINNGSVVFQIQSQNGDLIFFSSSKPDCNVEVPFAPGSTRSTYTWRNCSCRRADTSLEQGWPSRTSSGCSMSPMVCNSRSCRRMCMGPVTPRPAKETVWRCHIAGCQA